MQSKIWFINMVLAVLIVIFGIRIYQLWFAPDKQSVKLKNVQASSVQPAVRLLPKTVVPQASYQIIAEKTIFSPDRAEQSKKEADASSPQKAPAKFNLWGVMMLSDRDKRALVSEVAANSKKRWIKEGDTLDDRKVSSIQNDRVMLAGKDDQQEILLYDSAKLVRREQIKKDQEPIVIAGLGDAAQAKVLPKEEKTAEVSLIPPAEKKPDTQVSDKKVSELPKEKPKQPETPKTPAQPPTPPPASDVVNPFLNLLKGIK